MDPQNSRELLPIAGFIITLIVLIISLVRSARSEERVQNNVTRDVRAEIKAAIDAARTEFKTEFDRLRDREIEDIRSGFNVHLTHYQELTLRITSDLAVLGSRVGNLEGAWQELTIRSLRQVHQDNPATRRDVRLDDLIDKYLEARHMDPNEVRELIKLLREVENDSTVSPLRRDQAGRSLVGLRLKYPL